MPIFAMDVHSPQQLCEHCGKYPLVCEHGICAHVLGVYSVRK